MSEVQNNLGEKFKETITEAMKTGDFHALNTLVTDTVNDALREADFQANLSREATEKKVWNSQRSWQDKRREEVKTEAEIQAERQQREKQQEERRRQNEEWHRQRREREKQWEEQRKAQAEQNRARNQAQPVTPRKATAAEMTSLVKMEKKGNVSGTLCTVFGRINRTCRPETSPQILPAGMLHASAVPAKPTRYAAKYVWSVRSYIHFSHCF